MTRANQRMWFLVLLLVQLTILGGTCASQVPRSTVYPYTGYDMLNDFDSGTVGAVLTNAQLANSTDGAAGVWDATPCGTLCTTQTAGEDPAHHITGDTGTRGMAFNLGSGADGWIEWHLPSPQSSLSLGLWYKTGKPGNFEEGPHFVTLFNATFGNMLRLSDERSSGTNARQIRVSPLDAAVTGISDNTWYWCTMKWVQGGAGTFSVYDTSFNLVGSVNFADTFNFPTQTIRLGKTAGVGETGETLYFDDLIVDYTNGNFPLLPLPDLVSLTINPANPSVPKGLTQQLTVTGTNTNGSTEDLTQNVTWSSSNTAIATISATGLATGVALGTTNIGVSYVSMSSSATLTVTAPVLASIAVTPANALLQAGKTQQYTATGTYSDNSTQNLTSSVTWSSTSTTAATISTAGLATGVAAGGTTIVATLGAISGSTPLTVTTALLSIAVTPANPSVPKGLTQQFTAKGTYADGSTLDLTSRSTWRSGTTSVATITAAGLGRAVALGSSTITATQSGISGSTVMTVIAPLLSSITVTPANVGLAPGNTLQYTATGKFSDSSTQDITASSTWTSSNSVAATISSAGLATALAAGKTTIQAASGAITGSTKLTVTGLTAYWPFDEGTGTTAGDLSGNGYTATLVNSVSWTAPKIGFAAITANAPNGNVRIPAVDLTVTKAVTVALWVNRTYSTGGGHTLFENTANYNNSTTGFGVFPDDDVCNGILVGLQGDVGFSVNCYAQPSSGVWHHLAMVFDKTQAGNAQTALYIDGVLQTPTKSPNTSQNTNSFGNNASFVFSRGGTTEFNQGSIDDLRIYNRGLSATEIQQVYGYAGPTLNSVTVTPANPTIAAGQTQQFAATGSYSDGSTRNLTSSSTWNSVTPGAATITNSGLATGVGIGSSTIQATSGAVVGSTNLSVTAAALVSIAVTPMNGALQKGSTQQYTATGTYTDGSRQDLTSSVTWSSVNMGTATITSSGLVTGVAVGNTTIGASLGAVSGSTSLTVTAVLLSIAVTPANPSVAKGMTQHFIATGSYNDGSTLDITNSATWISNTAAVATISGPGLATAVAVGNSTIQATLGAITGSTVITVTPAVLTSIALTPGNVSILQGNTQQFTATGTYSDATTQDLTGSATWSSSAGAIVAISSGGLATGVGLGNSTIMAASGAVNNSTVLTVKSGPSGPIAYWTFDEASGTAAADSSGNGYAATLVNGVTHTAGKIGPNAVTANGTNGYVSIPAIDLSSTNAVTVALWANRTYSTSGGHVLFENSPDFNLTTTGFGIFPDDSSCHGVMVAVNGNGGFTINCYAQPTSGVWHHVAAVFDKSQPGSGQTALYIDGVLQTPTQHATTSANTNNFGNNAMYVFSRGGTKEFSGGSVDDLRIYSRALSAMEVQQLYQFTGIALTSIAVTPANGTIPRGQTQQFTATGTYSDGSIKDLTSVVTWNSTTAAVTINASGLASGASQGNSTVQATLGLITGSTNVTVTVPQLSSIAVMPSNIPLVIGGTQQYTATGIYTDGSLQDMTSSVTWGSSNGSATITNAGFAAAVASGNTAITATFGAVTGSTGLTVTASALNSISVTPVNASVAIGSTQQLIATGNYADGSAQDLTMFVTWSSSNSAIASIGSAGLATGVVTGNARIQAAAGAVIGSTYLGVAPAGKTFTQYAADNFGRANSPNLGSNWSPILGCVGFVGIQCSTQNGPPLAPLQIVNQQIQSATAGTFGKELYFGSINWPADQASDLQIISADGTGHIGASVRNTSADTQYACLVASLGTGNASAGIWLSVGGSASQLINSANLTISNNDVVRCQVIGSTISMIDLTTATTLLTTTNAAIPSGYPGVVVDPGTAGTSHNVAGSWAGGATSAPLVRQQIASDNFNRADSPDLGSNWSGTGDNHCLMQIVSNQIVPGNTPSGCALPAKEHYTASAFSSDQYSEAQVVASGVANAPNDNGAEIRFQGTDSHYLCDVNITGGPGTAQTRIVRVDSGSPNALVIDSTYAAIAANDFLIGQVQGSMVSCIDATTGTLALTALDPFTTPLSGGVPGWSLAPINSTPIGANWSGGNLVAPAH